MIDENSTDKNSAELAGLLRKGRIGKGWTLRRAATETGISNGYLSLIEHGKVESPSPRYLMAMADHYELPFDQLMALAGHPSGAEPASSPPGRMSARSAGGDLLAGAAPVGQAALGGNNDGEAWGSSPVVGADQDNEPIAVREAGPARVAKREPLQPTESVERQQLTALVLDDMSVLSAADIAQVRAFITGLRAARRR